MPVQWWVLLGALVIATAWGLLHRYRQGRIRRTPRAPGGGTPNASAGDAPDRAEDARPGAGLPDPIRAAVFGTDGGTVGGADPGNGGRTDGDADGTAGAHVVLLQLSTTFCAPCRHAKVILADLAERTPGLRHVEYDLTPTPEVASALRVLKTPTTLALDGSGRELFRVHGVPRRDRLAAELERHLRHED